MDKAQFHFPPARRGAVVTAAGVRYGVWSPDSRNVEVQIRPDSGEVRVVSLLKEQGGYFGGLDAAGRTGDRYKFRVNGGEWFPDPASRFQPEGVHDFSTVIDPSSYKWRDAAWQRPTFRDVVIYELHVGTFTAEGTFRAVIEKLSFLRDLGVTAIELLPIADFPGARNWGYDGVLLYAPARAYGAPDDLRAMVDAAHEAGIAVILDVVYNHSGPDGNYMGQYSGKYFSRVHQTPWGSGFNFDGRNSAEVRAFFADNPVYWMEEFHIDGFRLDATHTIKDRSETHILQVMAREIHRRGGYVIAEDERNEASLLRAEEEHGYNFDAVWADDFHHTARVSQTRESVAWFGDFKGSLPEVVDVLQNGWLYRGQPSPVKKRLRGTACRNLPPSKFVHCITNHDQAGNRAFGDRINASIEKSGYRALSMLLCLTPYTPMLFMGQEWAASTPFQFFCDHNPELGRLVTKGRREEFANFPGFHDEEALEKIPDPQNVQTFLYSKLLWTELQEPEQAGTLELYRVCLQLRKNEATFRPSTREGWEVDALHWGAGAIRYEAGASAYLLVFNLAENCSGSLTGQALTEHPDSGPWKMAIFSEETRFGGSGEVLFEPAGQTCHFNGPGAILLKAG